VSSLKWAGVADLDVAPVDCFAVYQGLAKAIADSYRTLAGVLAPLGGEDGGISARVAAVLGLAPQVLCTGPGYVWLNSVYASLATNDGTTFAGLTEDFARFEAAAAVSAGTSFSGPAAGDGEWIALPGTRVAVARSAGGLLRVVDGTVPDAVRILPTVGAMRLAGLDPLIRSPRSRSQFDLAAPDAPTGRAEEELRAAAELAARITPGLYPRYVTDIVPLSAEPGMANAGTDDAAPHVVYLSFGREPSDLLAALAHEESHALVQTLGKLVPDLLPDSELDLAVPWKPGVRRTLSGVLHGLVAFGRAATVRARAARAGHDSPSNQQALEREVSWVHEVTGQLCDGALGPLSEELVSWLAANRAAIDSMPPAGPDATVVRSLARSGEDGGSFPWALVGGPTAVAAADDLFADVTAGPWYRGTAGYPDQDNRPLDDVLARSPRAREFFAVALPAFVEERFGAVVELAAVKAHRLRQGDGIPVHSDGGHPQFAFRAVLGLTPLELDSGHLRLRTADRDLVVATQPGYAQALVFEMAEPSFHDVSANRTSYPRFTVIASYRRRLSTSPDA
jgi:HEXXH motif-containing protein